MAKHGETASRIFEAAEVLFCEHGFEAVSARDIAERAGTKKALVFYHFGSKAELFERVLDRYYERQMAALTGAFQQDGELGPRIHRMIDAYLDFMSTNSRYPKLVQRLLVGDSGQTPLIERNLAPLFDWIIETLADVAPPSGPLSAHHLYVSFAGIMLNYFTYAPVNFALWNADPLGDEALAERRAHVHWMVDAILNQLMREHLGEGEIWTAESPVRPVLSARAGGLPPG